jgi:hypothetical protein
MGGLATRDNPEEALSVHPEYMKIAVDRILLRSGVDVLQQAVVIDAIEHKKTVFGVEAFLLDGRALLKARVVIDATGDAVVAYLSGADSRMDLALQAITYHFRVGNVTPGATWKTLEEDCQAVLRQLGPDNLRYGGPWIIRLTDSEASINATRVYGNPVDPGERSTAERVAREDMLRIFAILRNGVRHLSSSYLITGATDLHVRESRKIVGDYVFTEQDIQERKRFSDVIALGAWPVDIHPTNGFVGVHPHKENPPEPYEIPYRCLLPQGIDGLLVAGRPISTTHFAHGSTRVPGTSMATGHAAGVAAALACRDKISPRNISVRDLQRELIAQGAILSLEREATLS